MRMTAKLKRNAKMIGRVWASARQRSSVVLIISEAGILTSIISNVKAIAKTPSQNASSLEFVFSSANLSSGDLFKLCEHVFELLMFPEHIEIRVELDPFTDVLVPRIDRPPEARKSLRNISYNCKRTCAVV